MLVLRCVLQKVLESMKAKRSELWDTQMDCVSLQDSALQDDYLDASVLL